MSSPAAPAVSAAATAPPKQRTEAAAPGAEKGRKDGPAEAVEKPPREGGVTVGDLVRQQRREFTLGSVMLVLSSTFAAAVPQCIRGASDAIERGESRAGTLFALGIAAAAVAGAAARVASRVYLFNGGRNAEYELRGRLLAHLHALGPAFYRTMSAGEIMSRATNDLGQVRLLLGFGALNIVNAAISYAVNLPLMVQRSPLLTLLALAPLPLFILVTRFFSGSMFRRSRATQDSLGALSEKAQQSLAGVRVVRAYGLELHEARTFEKLSNESLEANLALARLRGALFPILGTAAALGSMIVLWYGGRLAVQHRLTVGDLLAFQGHLALVAWPTVALGYIVSILARGRASLERLNDVFTAKPEVTDDAVAQAGKLAGEASGGQAAASLAVRDLSLSLDGRAVLEGVSFEVAAGKSIAIVGSTGSGKSALLSLLARMLPTPPNTVLLDGKDITAMPLRTLRTSVVLAQQEAFLFSTTVAKNIAFALADPDTQESLDRALNAAEEVQLLDEVSAMPDGLDTVVGERGVQLSGGQKQRVALARALLAKPRVLLLDDPLSAVDARTEARILDAIERAAKGRTLVLVTHRISAAARCDKALVLDAGRVVGYGTHDELLARGGLYARLAERQRLEAELEAL